MSPRRLYFNHAATSWPKPQAVLDAWRDFHLGDAASPGRSSGAGGNAAARALETVRRDLADFFAAPDSRRVIFTPSCTHALNFAIGGFLKNGDHVVTTCMEHNAVLRPLTQLQQKGFITCTIVDADREGRLDPQSIKNALRPETRLIVASHASNLIGTIQPIDDIASIARMHRVVFLLDASQSAGVLPIDMQRSGLDMIAIPSHKSLFGPAGSGALLVDPGVDLSPAVFGGTGSRSEDLNPAVEWPTSFEPGTVNAATILAWGAGIQHVADIGTSEIRRHELALMAALDEYLIKIPGIQWYGPADPQLRTAVRAITFDHVGVHEAAAILDSTFHISVRAGHSCAPLSGAAVGAPSDGLLRISAGYSNTMEDVAELAAALSEIALGAG